MRRARVELRFQALVEVQRVAGVGHSFRGQRRRIGQDDDENLMFVACDQRRRSREQEDRG